MKSPQESAGGTLTNRAASFIDDRFAVRRRDGVFVGQAVLGVTFGRLFQAHDGAPQLDARAIKRAIAQNARDDHVVPPGAGIGPSLTGPGYTDAEAADLPEQYRATGIVVKSR